jgi:probable rRNA maturation factor
MYDIDQSVSVRILSEPEIIDLNSRFRGKSEPTDVLTFPSGLPDPFPAGDIAIGMEYAMRQAELRGVEVTNEIAALIIHGVLHLAGFDDETEADRAEMQLEMKSVGEKLKLPIDAEWTSLLHQYKS